MHTDPTIDAMICRLSVKADNIAREFFRQKPMRNINDEAYWRIIGWIKALKAGTMTIQDVIYQMLT